MQSSARLAPCVPTNYRASLRAIVTVLTYVCCDLTAAHNHSTDPPAFPLYQSMPRGWMSCIVASSNCRLRQIHSSALASCEYRQISKPDFSGTRERCKSAYRRGYVEGASADKAYSDVDVMRAIGSQQTDRDSGQNAFVNYVFGGVHGEIQSE